MQTTLEQFLNLFDPKLSNIEGLSIKANCFDLENYEKIILEIETKNKNQIFIDLNKEDIDNNAIYHLRNYLIDKIVFIQQTIKIKLLKPIF